MLSGTIQCESCRRVSHILIPSPAEDAFAYDQWRLRICDTCWPSLDTPEKRRQAAVREARRLAGAAALYVVSAWFFAPLVTVLAPSVKDDVVVAVVLYCISPLSVLGVISGVAKLLKLLVHVYRLISGTINIERFL